MTEQERRDIGLRLENWSTWARESRGDTETTPIGRMYEITRLADSIAAGVVESSANSSRAIDEADALLLERNMRHLETKQRLILYWCYINRAQPEVVCRKVSIQHRPISIFIEQFRQAQAAIESLVTTERRKKNG
ncbi:hypothetical protein [Massilia oculi]|uniref:hypothetical protein n=1 Tax=Massilia oculi TaxID=945844 RepID=UPI001AAFC7E3|nr:hypothetical protein [Massilia oculi]